jgi:hypothetical protein
MDNPVLGMDIFEKKKTGGDISFILEKGREAL